MKAILLVATLFTSFAAQADIVCKVQTTLGPATVSIGEKQVTVSGAALAKTKVFPRYSEEYDGHMTSLLTAPGLAIAWDNTYGCIRNARITTNFRDAADVVGSIQSVQVAQCRGGTTSDEICRVPADQLH